jgi:hypothetical protein
MSFVKITNPPGSLNVLAILVLLFSARFGSLRLTERIKDSKSGGILMKVGVATFNVKLTYSRA